MSNTLEQNLGVGLDVGTMTILSARQQGSKVITNRIRDAFIDLDAANKKSLRLSQVDYIEKGDQLLVIGDSALNMANLFKREVRRPLSRGIISAGELDAQQVLSLLVGHVLGKPLAEGEHCYFSVPAAPIDDTVQDVIYHTEIFKKIISEYGFTPHPMNEAMAIVYSQCAESNFSGICASFGAGMINVALAYQTIMGLSFALGKGGDWVDAQSAKAVGSTSSRMCSIKERGVDLAAPKGRDEEALVLYIRSLIRYCLDNIATQFKKVQATLDLPDPIPFIVSGGTSKAGGFMTLFSEEFEAIKKKGFPIQISEIRHARDPMTAVAEGLLVLATEEHSG